MVVASLVGAVAVARLADGATPATLATALVGNVVVAVLRRHRSLAVALGVVVVGAGAAWWGLHISSHPRGLGAHAPRSLFQILRAARPVLVGFHLPLVHTAGVIALCALVGGLAAVAGRALGTRSPTLSLAPALVLVVWSAILLPSTGVALVGLVLGGGALLVLAGDGRTDRRSSAVVGTVSLGLAALTLGWSTVAGSSVAAPGGGEVASVAPSALSLAADLTGVERQDANVVLFRARTDVPTYWQVAALTDYVDGRWVPDPATAALIHGSTPVRTPVPPTGRRLFTAGVTLAGYSGRLLPAPPSTVTSSGTASPVLTASGVVAGAPVRAGSSYEVTAVVPAPVGDAPSGTPPSGAESALGPIPAVVDSLARSITAAQSSPLEKAEALTDFFRSGRFHYGLTATQPAGVDPLVSFLTRDRTGSCEQFAGAFAVLARASGLATRVVVGFTPGRPSGGVTVVRGSDAHAWPEVFLAGGWVSFEPTPQLPSGELPPPGVLGPSGLGQPNPTGPVAPPPVSIPVVTAPSATVPQHALPTPRGSSPDRVAVVGWISLLVLAVLVGATAGVLRRHRRVRRPPIDRVVAAWTSIDRALARRGLARPVWRTPNAHVRSLSGSLRTDQAQAALPDMATVATLLEDMTYGSSEPASVEVERAEQAARRARRAVLSGACPGRPDHGADSERRPHEFTDS